jgi:hypothetical protein
MQHLKAESAADYLSPQPGVESRPGAIQITRTTAATAAAAAAAAAAVDDDDGDGGNTEETRAVLKVAVRTLRRRLVRNAVIDFRLGNSACGRNHNDETTVTKRCLVYRKKVSTRTRCHLDGQIGFVLRGVVIVTTIYCYAQ